MTRTADFARNLPDQAALEAHQPQRRRGRPVDTDYGGVDAPLHAQMRQLLLGGVVPSRTKAAEAVAHLAYGPASERSKVKRLVASYPKWLEKQLGRDGRTQDDLVGALRALQALAAGNSSADKVDATQELVAAALSRWSKTGS